MTRKKETYTTRQLTRKLLVSGFCLAVTVVALHVLLGTHVAWMEIFGWVAVFLNVLRLWVAVYEWKQPDLLFENLEEWVKNRAAL